MFPPQLLCKKNCEFLLLLLVGNQSTRRSLIALYSLLLLCCCCLVLNCCCCCCRLHSRPAHVFKFIDCSAHKTRRLCFVVVVSPCLLRLKLIGSGVLLSGMGDVRVVVLCYIFRHLVCVSPQRRGNLCNLRRNSSRVKFDAELSWAEPLAPMQIVESATSFY